MAQAVAQQMAQPSVAEQWSAYRTTVLDREIDKYVRAGFRVVSRTPTTAQLVKPKEFSMFIALLGFLFLFVGLVLYMLIYMAEKDQTVYLSVDEQGNIHATAG